MAWGPDLQNNNQTNSNPYTPGGNEGARLRKLLLVAVGILVVIPIIVLAVHFLRSESQQNKYTKSATIAARKQTPNAIVTDVKVAGGFAKAAVSDPTAKGDDKTTVFRVNKDGSMVQLVKGSSFSPIDLLGLGMPLATQAKLAGSDVKSVKQNLVNQCGSSEGKIGYIGFDASFEPGEWQIDGVTLDGIEQALTAALSNKNAQAKADEKIICVNAAREKSNASTDKQTYISTFTLKLQLITGNGTATTHTFTFAVGPNHYRSYSLDGQGIQAR